MKTALFLVFFYVCNCVQAAETNEGLEAAEKLCQEMNFSAEGPRCLKLVSSARYFEKGAVQVCQETGFAGTKMECLEKIKDKVYTPSSVKQCKETSFNSRILECFETSGRQYANNPFIPPTENPAKKGVQKAIQKLDQGQYMEAKGILEQLVNEI
jgi:hypothetical protein